MSTSLQAMLAWGIDLGIREDRECTFPWENGYDDFEEFFAEKLGVPRIEKTDRRRAEAYWKQKKDVIVASGIDRLVYGFDFSSDAIIIQASLIETRGYSLVVDPTKLIVQDFWREQMARAQALINLRGEPNWNLFAYYG